MHTDQPFHPFPVLETQRLLLRQLTAADADDVFPMRADPEVMRYIPRPPATSTADVLALFTMMDDRLRAGDAINWGMALKETGKVIGIIGYVHRKPEHARAEVGYSLLRSMHRQGLMREALIRVMQYGFEAMSLHSIEAIIDAENIASAGLLEAAGFRQEAYFKEDFFLRGSFRNSVHYGMLRTEGAAAGICT